MSDHPKVAEAPGLIWKPRKEGWVAYWQARSDIVRDGFETATVRLWEGVEPSEIDRLHLSEQCKRLQADMLLWSKDRASSRMNVFDGTVKTLIQCFQTDPNSRYHKLRYSTRRNHDTLLRRITNRHGDERLSDIKARTLLSWSEEWGDHGQMLSTWQAVRGQLRVLFSFGFALLEDAECDRLCRVMSSKAMQFETPNPKKQAMTATQAALVCKVAHDHFGWHSIALAQTIQFEGILRQRDAIGEWVPLSEPGTSDITWEGQKWIRGVRWNAINENLILTHTTSKKQKVIEIDLKLAPMVMEELALMVGVSPAMLTRDMLPASGAVIVNTVTGMPYDASEFRRKWRLIANKAGLPKEVKNMHSRHGGVTEAIQAGAPPDQVRRAATHSNIKTTEGYMSEDINADAAANVMRLRVAGRNKPKPE